MIVWADGVNGCGWCLAGGRGCWLFLALPHSLHCPICSKDIMVTVLLLQVMWGWQGWGWFIFSFLVENDKKIYKKVIRSMQQIFKRDNKVTLLKWSCKGHKHQCLTQKELQQLLDTAFFFFRFLEEFRKYKGIENIVEVYAMTDCLQSFDTYYCRSF